MKYCLALLCLSLNCFANETPFKKTIVASVKTQQIQPTTIHYQIIAERSHKPNLFTQGLVIKDGYFYESSGLYAKSMLVAYPVAEPETTWAKLSAPFYKKHTFAPQYFAEGVTILNNKLYQLTWQENTVFVMDAANFTILNTFNYQGEGWGLTTNSSQLIRSDGSSNLFFHNRDNFSVEKKIHVSLNQQPIDKLNELEYAEGFIWANIWHDNRILKINPETGVVVGVLDLTAIAQKINLSDAESVLNGIAYDADKKALWITGKQWPKMYLLKCH